MTISLLQVKSQVETFPQQEGTCDHNSQYWFMDLMAARKTKSLPDGVSARSLGGLDIRDFEKTVSARCPGSSKFDFLAEN